jgi:hypothetical protein
VALGASHIPIGVPVQPVDATPSDRLIWQYFPSRIDLYGSRELEPKQGSVLFESKLANEITFVDSFKKTSNKCCIDRLSWRDLSGHGSGFRGPVLVFWLFSWSSWTLCKIEQTCSGVLNRHGGMKKEDLTPKQMSSVSRPTCGVPAGKRCILYSGGLRFEPHLIRKLSAAAALARK